MDFFTRICILSLLSVISIQLISNVHADPNTFNVQDYGAVGDQKTDDSWAFLKAWNATCSATTGTATMIIPKGKTFLVYPITFWGPCKSTTVYVTLSGTVKAPEDPSAWKDHDVGKWLEFQGINGLNIDGYGQLDGSGQKWWDQSCKLNPGKGGCTKLAPTVLGFRECKNVNMSHIFVISSPQTHILVLGGENVYLKDLTIRSPGTSPNTDGIHISHSNNVLVDGSFIESGDDCVSIGDASMNIHVSYCECELGHGVSIGSLGRSGNEVLVENITVEHVNFNQTSNGGRIKTWQVGRGQVRNVEFSYLNFTNVQNPIIIDQYYCDVAHACKGTKTGVKISDVRYIKAFGTSTTPVAINLNCSNIVPCTGITFEDVQLESASSNGQVTSSCNNAFGNTKGIIKPNSCLK
ncbi:hypothetical protein JRO89_XSUnG0182100 [Xanthoceras sorbifolium]|uniref:Polygalacturonase n=1 Tax=Xanthoceras sorbifolium TaxID=99658 RepID=A0ABQ8GXH8_9ROSI|nr:hypothetical protein JRO89_XSUnG0182100 [Xanthoceras sorbifolium]